MPRDAPKRTPNAPPGHWPKRLLAVRVLAARVAWLDSPPRWEQGRVVWDGPSGPLAPTRSDLARAERSLKKIESYPVSAALALGDRDAWLGERSALLDVAKRLCGLHLPAADLPAVAGRAARLRPP